MCLVFAVIGKTLTPTPFSGRTSWKAKNNVEGSETVDETTGIPIDLAARVNLRHRNEGTTTAVEAVVVARIATPTAVTSRITTRTIAAVVATVATTVEDIPHRLVREEGLFKGEMTIGVMGTAKDAATKGEHIIYIIMLTTTSYVYF
jgi:hypothetical protein